MAKRTNTAKWMPKYERWQINVQRNGERKSFYSPTPGRDGQRECNKKADEWLDSGLSRSRETVNRLFDEYVEFKRKTNGDEADYIGYIGGKWIKTIIGRNNRRIGVITENDCQQSILAMHDAGCHKSYMVRVRGEIRRFLKFAKTCGATMVTGETIVIPSGAPDVERNSLDYEDIKKLFTSNQTKKDKKVVDEFYINLFRFACIVGRRPGELRGIEPKRDIVGNIFTLHKAINSKDKETNGKNKNASKPTALPAIALRIIEEQKELLKRHGIIHSKYLFPDEYNEATKYRNVSNAWKRYKEYNGIKDIVLYELRHTFTTVCKEGEMPEEMVKKMVCHSSKTPTFGLYGHDLKEGDQRAADWVDNVFSKIGVL